MIGVLMCHLAKYKRNAITFRQINKAYIEGFVDYMKTITQINDSKKTLT